MIELKVRIWCVCYRFEHKGISHNEEWSW